MAVGCHHAQDRTIFLHGPPLRTCRSGCILVFVKTNGIGGLLYHVGKKTALDLDESLVMHRGKIRKFLGGKADDAGNGLYRSVSLPSRSLW